jgi:hypothetical protein
MKLSGGAVVNSVITPSAIKQVGIINLDKFEEDRIKLSEQTVEVNIPSPPAEETPPSEEAE